MTDWLTKPYIEWNIIDTILCYLEISILLILVIIISAKLLEIRDKRRIKNGKTKKGNR